MERERLGESAFTKSMLALFLNVCVIIFTYFHYYFRLSLHRRCYVVKRIYLLIKKSLRRLPLLPSGLSY